jgi:hypothetical protein
MTNASKTIGEMINEKSPTELKAINRSTLRAMGANATDAERLVENSAFTPTQQTAFVFNLKTLENVANRGAFIHSAAEKSSTEADALFCMHTAALMSQLHTGQHPLARIVMMGDFPVCVAKDGTVVVALQWDYAAWTPRAASFADEIEAVAKQPDGKKPVAVAISGQMSPRLQQELQSRHITVQDRVNPGPLR